MHIVQLKTTHTLIHGDSRKMALLPDLSVDLIVTSPPYWQLKDYGVEHQIGFHDTYEAYIDYLNLVWTECFRVLRPGCRLCINIGDQFSRAAHYGRYKVVPIHSEIIRFCECIGFDFMGDIIWQKPTNSHPTGGQKVMGSYPYPKNGIVKIDYEHILIFKKLGKAEVPSPEMRQRSILTDEEWRTYFSSHWTFSGVAQNRHQAVFPEELPKRLIRMFSFVGETVLDPFMGSGTTALAAMHQHRSSIGYELNGSYLSYYKEKVIDAADGEAAFLFKEDSSTLDLQSLVRGLPYSLQTNEAALKQPMVLINHARGESRQKMAENGICYLRAGDVKGSVLIQSGFERLQYVLLHTGGEEASLYKLSAVGKYQLWTREDLMKKGFQPAHADTYIVLHFDNTPIPFKKLPNLKEDKNTFRVKIRPLSDFL